MAQPVWVLSVDLQTKTATFQTGLADAAKSARGAFQDIKGGAGEMGGAVGYEMGEARHSVMLLGEEFGVHLPRGVTTFIASIGPLGPALEAAFPFLAIAVGATLLIEHLAAIHEAGEKLTEDQVEFGTAVNNAFNALDQKIIQTQIKTDELRNNHLGALQLQLKLIDMQSMGELVHQFEEVAKSADVVMKGLEGHWYTFGIGSEGAKHTLEEFKDKYENFLSTGTDAGKQEASNLLSGYLQAAREVLKAQQTIKANRDSGGGATDDSHAAEQLLETHKASLSVTDGEIAAQEKLVGVLQAQLTIEEKVATAKHNDKGNATQTYDNGESAKRAAAARQSAESMMRMGEQSLAADKATAESSLAVHRASLEERLSSDIEFAGRDRDIKEAANQQEIAGLDKSGKDYTNQLKALQDKALEISSEYDAKVTELKAKSAEQTNSRDIQALEQSEREKIEATQQGSAARLAAIDASLKQEESRNLQDTSFFRDLLNQRTEFLTKAGEEEGKLREEGGRQGAEADVKAGELRIAAEKQQTALADSARRISAEQRVSEETKTANEEYEIKQRALQKEISTLNTSGADYQNKLKALQDKETELTQQHENELAEIREKAEQESNQRILAARTQLDDSIARGLTQSIMGHQSWAKMVISLGQQVVGGMIENAIKSMLADDMTKERDAAAAARKAFNMGMSMGGPAGFILGPVMGAAAFASVMAFQSGTEGVPGVGRGDIVPTMLEPGEGVVPGGVMDGLKNMARNGGFQGGGHTYHVHVRPTYHVNTIDGDGMKDTLERHTDQLQEHFQTVLRRMNK